MMWGSHTDDRKVGRREVEANPSLRIQKAAVIPRNQRDEIQVEWTGLHHLFSVADGRQRRVHARTLAPGVSATAVRWNPSICFLRGCGPDSSTTGAMTATTTHSAV